MNSHDKKFRKNSTWHKLANLSIYAACAIFVLLIMTNRAIAQNADYYYVDKLFGKRFTYTPKSDEVMVKFIAPSSVLQKSNVQSVASRYHLTTVHDATAAHQFGVYKIAAGTTLTAALSQLRADPSVRAVSPVMTDQENYTRYFIPDEFTVQFNKNLSKQEITALIQSYGCEIVTAHWTYGYYTLALAPGQELFSTVRLFMDLPQVKFSELSFIGFDEAVYDPTDLLYAQQWALNNTGTTGGTADADIDAREGWDIERGDPNILIVVIDSGVDWDHPDLRGNIAQNLLEDADGDGQTMDYFGGVWRLDPGDINGVDDDGNGQIDDLIGWDFYSNDNNPVPVSTGAADHSYPHGTCCAGLAVAIADNVIGVVGVAHHCRLMPLRIDLHSGMNQNRADAINYAASFHTRYDGIVLSCSWVASGDITAIHNAMVDAKADGVVICFAAGNNNTTPINYPARYSECIAVGATCECDTRKRSSSNPADLNVGVSPDPLGTSCDGEDWWGSNYGDDLDVAAPGVHLNTTDIVGMDGYSGTDYVDTMNGTSGATPHVAGAAALLLSYDHTLTPDQVQEILQSSADKVGGYDYSHDPSKPGHSLDLGYGRLNVNRALQMLMARTGGMADLLPSPTDLVLSLDRSGSMTGGKLDAVINAASQVIRLMDIGDQIGITKYNQAASQVYPAGGGVAEITAENIKDDAIASLGTLAPSGRTSIGGGLAFAQAQLDLASTPHYPQSIILMSDGLSNEPTWIKDAVPVIPTATDVYTIGFGTAGEDVDEDSLSWIASETGGIYFFAGVEGLMQSTSPAQSQSISSIGGIELINAYQASLNLAVNRDMLNLYSRPLKEKFTDSAYVDASVYEVRFTLLWENPKYTFSLVLFSPSGKKIEPSSAEEKSIDYISDKTLISYRIRKPEAGVWVLVGTGQGQRYFISTSAYSYLKSKLSVFNWGAGLPLLIKLRLLELGLPILNARVTGSVALPNHESVPLNLYDDGKHRDEMADDGIYGNIYANAGAPGSYVVETLATGRTSKQKQTFSRYNIASVYVKKDGHTQALNVALPNIISPAKRVIKIPVYLNTDATGRGVNGFNAKIAFDPEIINPTKQLELAGTLMKDWNVRLNKASSSEIEIQGDGKELAGSGVLLFFIAEIQGKENLASKLNFTDLALLAGKTPVPVTASNGSLRIGETLIVTDVEGRKADQDIPKKYALLPNYPNPFNAATSIHYQLHENSFVELSVYNILGQEVAKLVDAYQPAGYYSCRWCGKDNYDRDVASGIYLYRIKTKNFTDIKKMFLLR